MHSQEINSLVKRLKDLAKNITLSIPKLDIAGDNGMLHAQSIDLLMGLTELEGKLPQHKTSDSAVHSKETKISSSDEDLEAKKVKGRLPRWGNNPNQINSRILALFLKLSKTEAPVKVNELKNAYGNDGEFDKNFAQMKMISERNHGKVFEVSDGVVEIWPKVIEYVEGFSKQVGI
ncbi:MAG: hypothetical protein J0665_18475 [Deltaproteobacteria bacterium]|nr:hypothetical protein [Deltaproteobacteria bacterium]